MNQLHVFVLLFLKLMEFTSLLGQQQDEKHTAFLSQSPEYEIRFPGESSKIDCFYCIPGITVKNHLIYWYKKSPDFLRVATVSNNAFIYVGQEYENRLHIFNKEEHLTSLIITNLSTSDNGIFFCEIVRTAPPPILKLNGSGTNITVQEKETEKGEEKENEEGEKETEKGEEKENEEGEKEDWNGNIQGTCLSYTPVIVVATVAGAAILLLVTVLIMLKRNSWSLKSYFPGEANRTGLEVPRGNKKINMEEEGPYQVLVYEKDRTLGQYSSFIKKEKEKSSSDMPQYESCK